MMSKNPLSIVIVAIYLLALLYLFVSGEVFPESILTGVLYSLGVMLGLWAGWTLRTTNWQITPEVANGAILIENGPYTYVRHPMYLAVILVASGLLLNDFSPLRAVAFVVIFVDLLLKIRYEEDYLHRFFPKYKDYLKKTFKLFPYVY